MTSSLFFIITLLFPFTLAVTRDVHVGELDGVVTFDPWFVHAKPSDVVNFVFDTPSADWSVTQSSYDSPCVPLASGVSSGVIHVPAGASSKTFPTFTYKVNSADPAWFFCGQQDLCRQGVVFAVNPPGDQGYYLFRSQAVNASNAAPVGAISVSAPDPTSTSTTVVPPSGNAAVINSSNGKAVDSGAERRVMSGLPALLLIATIAGYYRVL